VDYDITETIAQLEQKIKRSQNDILILIGIVQEYVEDMYDDLDNFNEIWLRFQEEKEKS
jgi:hypothetical protein